MTKVELRVDWCSHEAAKYAVEHWHYSRSMPVGKMAKFGAWEDGKFIGCVVYSWGANNNLGNPYGLTQVEVCELVRVALTKHESNVSQIVSFTLRMLSRQSPGLRLIVSFADPYRAHTGSIYQAMNWVYAGVTPTKTDYELNGQVLNRRAYTGRQFGKANSKQDLPALATPVKMPGKHRYLYPLDRAMRKQIAPLSKPYPKRDPAGEATGVAPGDQPGEGGSIPTHPLHTSTLVD